MKKDKKFRFIGIATSCFIAGSIASLLVGNVINRNTNAKNYKDVQEYMLKSDYGSVLTLPIDENPISIVFENLSEKDRNSAIEAVRDLDEVSTNINYKILDSDDAKITQKIYVFDEDLPSGEAGRTNISFDNYSGKISYPVYIKIDTSDCNKFISEDTGETALKAVLKHELGHSLGLCDLYDEKYKDESIMWHELHLEDYTESDKERIRRIYGGESENVEIEDLMQNKNQNAMSLPLKQDWYKIIRPKFVAITKKENENSYIPKQNEERTF